MGSPQFTGPLAYFCIQFVEYKHAVGCKYYREVLSLQAFDLFCKRNFPKAMSLNKELVYAWTARQSHETPNNQLFRISVIRQFAKYLDSQGYDSFIHPPCYNMTAARHVPYVFTEDEIGRILYSADHLEKRNVSPYYHITTPIIMKTLYGCGLRITEALTLRMRDVDMKNKIIIVLDSKYGKNRIAPMSDSLWKAYLEYITFYRFGTEMEDPLFPDLLTAHGFYSRFREVLRMAGISHRGRGKGPRLHDMRHTFAVHCLNRWVREGRDIYAMLPILSEYLGHNSISATSDYLRLTPASFQDFLYVAKANHPLLNHTTGENVYE